MEILYSQLYFYKSLQYFSKSLELENMEKFNQHARVVKPAELRISLEFYPSNYPYPCSMPVNATRKRVLRGFYVNRVGFFPYPVETCSLGLIGIERIE